MPQIIIRIAKIDDAKELLEIYSHYVKNTSITFEWEVPSLEEFENRISNTLKKYPYIVAVKDDKIVGYAYASPFKSRVSYNWAIETSIYVHKDFCRCGIGKALLTKLESLLASQNILNSNACIAYPEIEDEYLTKNSVRFHEKMGYRLVGEFHKCAYKFGRWYNMVWMEKMIGEHMENQPEVIPFSKNVKAVIFDMDGVLLDSESICDKTWAIASKEMNIPMDEKTLNACRGCNKSDTKLILKKRYGEDFDAAEFLSRTSELFYEVEDKEGIALMPFVKETLEYLSKKYVLCLASSTRMEAVSRQLKNAGLIDYFKTLTTGDMVTHSKPEPEIYLMACKSIGIEPENCVAIEDSYNGVRSAVSANIRTIMVPDRLPSNDEMKKICFSICDSLKEVQKIL